MRQCRRTRLPLAKSSATASSLAVPMASVACTTLRSTARCSVCRCGVKSLRPLRLARRLRTPGASRALARG